MSGLYDDQLLNELLRGTQSLVGEWGLSDQTDVRLLTISENMTCLAYDPTQDKQLILRVHRPGYHTREEIQSELLWINDLRQQGVIETPKPITTRSGAAIASFSTGHDIRDVVAFSFMSGKEPATNAELINGFRQLGSISAKLHTHSQNWVRPETFVRKTWNFNTMLGATPLWGDWRAATGLTEAGQHTIEQACLMIQDQLETYGMRDNRFGLIHADLRLANLLIDGDRLGVIDFDDCGLSWFMYDFAAAISFIEDDPIVPSLQSAWIEGYRDHRPLSAVDEAMFPTFIILRRILLTAWLASHSETPTAQELGSGFTAVTVDMATQYISRHQ
ncbi:phosphotransferase [Amphritea sp. 1_MG-2023]|uniref:phosphotransferase enzyme family protein n=1 Tax=Amphritea sp. 1_MG-2023 TaxID=3062670 RepID=UPI0026E32424|nr:phosphotransferase [Amphritea sp. 1_MG-2023]MDO6565371.1 phosphotransferase [Amphritea sp. 1_MG-2023]